MKTIIIKDTNYSFLQTTTNAKGETFTRKLEKGTTEYSNACMMFHRMGVALEVGNKVER